MARPRDSTASDRILDAAEALFLEAKGEFSIGAVAQLAGVSRGSVYRRFASREALMEALVTSRGVDPAKLARPETRARILDAVSVLLRARGLSGMTVEAVAKGAGVSAVTIYRHFKDRDGLVQAYGRERSPRRLAAQLALSDGRHLREDLTALAEAGLRFIAQHPHLVRMELAAPGERATMFARTGAQEGSSRQALQAYIGRQVEAGRLQGDPKTLARAFFGMILAAALIETVAEEDTAACATEIVSILLDGCLVRGATP